MNKKEWVQTSLLLILIRELTPCKAKYDAWLITMHYLQADPVTQKEIESSIQSDLDRIEEDRQQTEKYWEEEEKEYARQHEYPPYIPPKKSFWNYINWLWI